MSMEGDSQTWLKSLWVVLMTDAPHYALRLHTWGMGLMMLSQRLHLLGAPALRKAVLAPPWSTSERALLPPRWSKLWRHQARLDVCLI